MHRIFVFSITFIVFAFVQAIPIRGFYENLVLNNVQASGSLNHNSKDFIKSKSNERDNFAPGHGLSVFNITDPPLQPWFPVAPALPALPANAIRVATVQQLFNAVESVKPGGTIAIADGQYKMTKSLVIRTNNVTLRSESGDRTKVILDFKESIHGEGIVINSYYGFMLASLTVQNVTQNGIKVNSNLNVDKVTIYNVISHNVWQRHIKGPRVPDDGDGNPSFVEDCNVRYCLFYNDRPKQLDDEPYEKENPDNFNGNYVGGIDIMTAKNWNISDNVFIGIRGRTGEARGGIFIWHNSHDIVIERNIFINNDSGICLGNSSSRGERRHCTGLIVRNNFITRVNANEGIFAGHTENCKILFNTIHNSGTGRLIRIAHANDGMIVEGNVFSGSNWGVNVDETDNIVPIKFNNNINKLLTNSFTDPDNGNLHLKSTATDLINKGPGLELVTHDIDGHLRDNKPDLGADEFGSGVTGTENYYQNRHSYLAFPNPTYGNLTLKGSFSDNKNVYYRIFDLNGKLLETSQVTENETRIHTEKFNPAVYSLVIYELSQGNYEKFNPTIVNTIKVIKK